MNTSTLEFPLIALEPGEDAELGRAVEAGVYADRLTSVYGPDPRLLAVAEAGEVARERLWWAGVRIAAALAHRQAACTNLALDDLFQDACVAVAEAVCAWDHRRGAQFTTFVYHRVTLAMRTTGRHRGGSWAASKGDRRAAMAATREQHRLEEGGIELTIEDVAERMGLSPAAATRGSTVLVSLPADPIPDPDSDVAFVQVEESDMSFLELLDPVHRRLLRLRFGLDGRIHTIREAAAELGLSSSSTARSEQHALALARRILTSERTEILADPRLSPERRPGASYAAFPAR